MTITLNHTIVPARDNRAAAHFFARIFGLHADRKGGHFAPVRINDTLTLLFDDDEEFESHHCAFHVSDAEFDAILGRIREAKLVYGSAPWNLDDGKLNDWNGGRGTDVAKVARRKLVQLNNATMLGDLAAPPGDRLEALRGDLAGKHSIRIN